ncbi:hypothetical protein THITH_04745 [Thioalkalivibrio paradoxus ARh 1]|uniref:Uncharacterized protein n=1 Tax=Thioalkalivibrio paradoxus ARh 1 TaxID=713585 RepID=W0DSI3_9GAMM|nr:hypothetical protein THITH_04745 [Thioalkalivibrio paradoxus ARh 1]
MAGAGDHDEMDIEIFRLDPEGRWVLYPVRPGQRSGWTMSDSMCPWWWFFPLLIWKPQRTLDMWSGVNQGARKRLLSG